MIGPLGQLSPESDVCFVIDALDRLATGARGPVMDALNELAGLPFSRVIVTARPETPLPNDCATAYLLPLWVIGGGSTQRAHASVLPQ